MGKMQYDKQNIINSLNKLAEATKSHCPNQSTPPHLPGRRDDAKFRNFLTFTDILIHIHDPKYTSYNSVVCIFHSNSQKLHFIFCHTEAGGLFSAAVGLLHNVGVRGLLATST